jgi:hypothetical protein
MRVVVHVRLRTKLHEPRCMAAFKAALDLMRRLPPRDVEKNLGNALALAPELLEDLLSAVDQPLKAIMSSEKCSDGIQQIHEGADFSNLWPGDKVPGHEQGFHRVRL